MRGIPGLSVAHVQHIRSIAEAVRDTVERTRYAISHRPLFRPLLLILQLLAFILTLIFRLCLRFSHPILSLAVLAYTLNAVWAFWLSKLSGSWGPAFPAVRTGYVIALVSLPIWGLAMAVFTLLWFALARVWGVVGTRLRRGQRYEPIVVDLDDLEPGERAERRWRAEEQRKGVQDGRGCARAKRGAGWFVLWCGYVALALFGVHMARTYELPVDHRFKSAVELANRVPKREGYGTGEKIFLAAMFYNNGGVLPYWITEVTKLIYYLGPDNVFVSIVESNSPDHTASLLEEFDRTLEAMGVARRVLTHDTTIERPASMETGLPRITFLAAVRNLAMQPLYEKGGYTRVIFSNDVFIEAASIAELLDTKGGDYDMACGLDLAYWGLYDQWVIRDHSGRFASTLYPYFLEDMGWRGVTTDEPAPVFTCWNGIVAFRADPFLPLALRSGNQLSTKPLSRPLASTHPAYGQPANMTPALTPPLRFRTHIDGECFSSESFLLPYDLRRQFDMNEIYVNPRVICSYSWEYYVWFKWVMRHWAVKWFVDVVENGRGVEKAKMILGGPERVWEWDGGECHPW
ncbi:cryptococcal mannosyltransferase 1-domain-containing protein [Mycena epipterygia]|nr:cryptococcal mannosyltransferase 1-domain-containing protein [Mycena epipterygia]